MKIKFIPIFLIFGSAICLFDEELIMDKPIKGSALFLRALNQNEFYISNSLTNYIFNIRTGQKRNFTGIIPLNSTIDEPFLLFVNKIPSFFIDAHTINDYVKIYDIRKNIYKEYTALKMKDEFKRKFCKFNIENEDKFVIGVEDTSHKFQIRLITTNGTEIFRSQLLDIKSSNDFHIFTWIYKDKKNFKRAIIAIIFYESKFVMHQWSKNNNDYVYYTTASANSNQFIKQNNVQMSTNGIFCGQDNKDVNCHIIKVNFQGGFNTKVFNIQMLEKCKSDFKLNILNNERYVVSCLNTKNEFIIQLFSVKLERDFDKKGMILFKDDTDENYSYDVVQGKNNELVVIKADLSKNKYFIETFNFIKNTTSYILCPPGCQDCYWKDQLGYKIGKTLYQRERTLNCTLCKFNSYFSDNYADLCFLKKEKPLGYEFIEKYNKFSSCDYCCKTNNDNVICDVCLQKEKYEYFLDEPNNGRCVQNCTGKFFFIKKDQKACTDSCTGVPNCIAYKTYLENINNNNSP